MRTTNAIGNMKVCASGRYISGVAALVERLKRTSRMTPTISTVSVPRPLTLAMRRPIAAAASPNSRRANASLTIATAGALSVILRS